MSGWSHCWRCKQVIEGITHQGSLLIPVRIDGEEQERVEFQSQLPLHYLCASDEMLQSARLATEEQKAAIAHCKKPLHDLPFALVNSVAAMKTMRNEKNDAAIHELGMVVLG